MMQEFLQQVENLFEEAMGDIHTAVPGQILEYDPASGMASVQPVASYMTPAGQKIPYPVISGVPVCMPKSEGIEIAFPVRPGDTCLLIIAESDIAPAIGAGEEEIPMRFDLTNALAIPGFGMPQTDAAARASAENAVAVVNGGTQIMIKDGSVEIKAEQVKIDGNLECTGVISGTLEGGGG